MSKSPNGTEGSLAVARNVSVVAKTFVSKPIVPTGEGFVTPASGSEPPVPRVFAWGSERLQIDEVLRAWRSTKNDRGDTYVKRHWFELLTTDRRRLEVYFDRDARRGASPWWLYTIDG